MRLPPIPSPRRDAPAYRIVVVCLGNICRSPMAQVVLEDRLAAAGLAHRVEVLSAGTGGWHVGGPMDRRAAATLSSGGYDPTGHLARQVGPDWLTGCDLVLAMDTANRRDLAAMSPPGTDRTAPVRMFRDFDPDGPGDVPDPYAGDTVGGGFAEVLATVERTADALVPHLRDTLGPDR